MRRAHWIKGNAVTKIPKWHICVATTVRPDPADPDVRLLDRAVIRVGCWSQGRWAEHGCSIYPTAESFWTAIIGHVHHCPRPWVWLLDPAQDCPALQLTRLV